jgi:hypothetical protein
VNDPEKRLSLLNRVFNFLVRIKVKILEIHPRLCMSLLSLPRETMEFPETVREYLQSFLPYIEKLSASLTNKQITSYSL